MSLISWKFYLQWENKQLTALAKDGKFNSFEEDPFSKLVEGEDLTVVAWEILDTKRKLVLGT